MITLTKLDRAAQDEITLQPFVYIHKEPSKYHKTIVQIFNYWLKSSEKKVREIEEILRITHTTTLILDDIQDNSKYRYGVPVAQSVFGVGFTVNAVTQALCIALKKVVALDHPEAINIYLNAFEECVRGQGIEMHWRDNFQCPTEEEYFDMLKQKSSTMFIVTFKLLQLFSESKENYLKIATLLGVYYSSRDDYCNLFNRESLQELSDNQIEKGITGDSDITEGKFTLPIIHALRSPDVAEEVIDILKQRPTDINLINHCTSILKNRGSDKYTGDILRRLEQDIEEEITRLGSNPVLTSMMKDLRNWKKNGEL